MNKEMTPEQLARADDNYFHSYRILMENMKRGGVDLDLRYTDSGTNFIVLNVAILTEPFGLEEERVRKCLDHFKQVGRTVRFVFRAPVETVLEALPSLRSCEKRLAAPLMVHSGLRSFAPSDDFDWRAVESEKTLSDYNSVMMSAYGVYGWPEFMIPKVLTMGCAQRADVIMIVGYVDGDPATGAMAVIEGDLAGVYWVGTKPEYGRRNLASKVTNQVAYLGSEMGCTWSVLQASVQGGPVYQRMGYTVEGFYQGLTFDPKTA